MFSRTYFGKAYNEEGVHTGPGLWLNLVWEANRIEPGFFGAPVHLRPGVEDYAYATIAHAKHDALPDETFVTVAAKDEHGSEVLTKAAEALEATLNRDSPRDLIQYRGREAGAGENDS